MARILIVDDESNVRMMVRLALQHVGHEVTTAADGAEGLATFGSGDAYDLVLLDHRMPGLSGLDVLRQMRVRDRDARVVVITAFGTVDLAVEAAQAGATDFLRKPFTAEMLRSTVQAALVATEAPDDRTGSTAAASGLSSINGFRVLARPAHVVRRNGDLHCLLTVRLPDGDVVECEVVLPAHVVGAAAALAERERQPSGDGFWQGLAAEALANFLWQNAVVPGGGSLVVEDLTPSMRRWVDSTVLAS